VGRIGSFAAHRRKDSRAGTILEVEPGEAEWNLVSVDGLFDHFFRLAVLLCRNGSRSGTATTSRCIMTRALYDLMHADNSDNGRCPVGQGKARCR
jgi:hypothetical protein